jgi:hypothetical protein
LIVVWLALACGSSEEEVVKEPQGPIPVVVVDPAVEKLPINALRFRLSWSEIMALIPDNTRVTRDGNEVPRAIVDKTWDSRFQLATIVLDNIEPNAKYELVVDGFSSSAGVKAPSQSIIFFTLPADEQSPTGDDLSVHSSAGAGTLDKVEIHFGEPMSTGGVNAMTVLGGGSPWPGSWSWHDNQTKATFTPGVEWDEQPVRVSFGAGLTDLAGNPMANRPVGMVVPSRL